MITLKQGVVKLLLVFLLFFFVLILDAFVAYFIPCLKGIIICLVMLHGIEKILEGCGIIGK